MNSFPTLPRKWIDVILQTFCHVISNAPGGTRLAHRCVAAAARCVRRNFIGHSPDGFNFYTAIGSHVELPLFIHNYYEKDIHDYICRSLQPGMNFVDVGANIGCFTLLAARLSEQGSIYCFEPDPDAFSRLQANIDLNSFKNVHAFPLALGQRAGNIKLYRGGSDWTHCSSIHPSSWHNQESRSEEHTSELQSQ